MKKDECTGRTLNLRLKGDLAAPVGVRTKVHRHGSRRCALSGEPSENRLEQRAYRTCRSIQVGVLAKVWRHIAGRSVACGCAARSVRPPPTGQPTAPGGQGLAGGSGPRGPGPTSPRCCSWRPWLRRAGDAQTRRRSRRQRPLPAHGSLTRSARGERGTRRRRRQPRS